MIGRPRRRSAADYFTLTEGNPCPRSPTAHRRRRARARFGGLCVVYPNRLVLSRLCTHLSTLVAVTGGVLLLAPGIDSALASGRCDELARRGENPRHFVRSLDRGDTGCFRAGRTYRALFVVVGDEVRVLRVRGSGQPPLKPEEFGT